MKRKQCFQEFRREPRAGGSYRRPRCRRFDEFDRWGARSDCVGRGALPALGFTRDIGSGFNDRTSRELQRTTVDGRSGGWFSSVLGVANDSTAYGRSDGDGLYPGGLCREPRHDLRRKRYFRIGGYEGTRCIGNLDLGNDLTRGVVILRSRRKRDGLS